MRKLLLTLLFSGCFLLAATTKVQAAGWEAVVGCTDTQYTPEQISGYIKSDNPQSIVTGLKTQRVCIRTDVTNFQISELAGEVIYYCKSADDKAVLRNFDGSYEKTCCPISSSRGRGTYCCPNNSTELLSGSGGAWCQTPTGNVPPVESSERAQEVTTDSIQVFVKGEEKWQCPAEDCLMNLSGGTQTLMASNSTLAQPITLAQRSSYNCQPKGVSLAGMNNVDGTPIPADSFCAFQSVVSGPIATLLDSNSDIDSCLEIDGIEKERCLECMKKNLEARNGNRPESFVYSSIGCVDTRQDQFITRLFQIGLGTISGISVIQVMWGMIERQSTDPAKIQQGRDRAIAALTALATVAGAIPILRFLGINVAQLLPISFLG